MPSTWPELDDLIRELAEMSALPHAEAEPLLSEASMAVSKATAELARAAGPRHRGAVASRERALRTIEEARAAVERARKAIATSARRGAAGRTAPTREGAPVEGRVEAMCPACRQAFVVRYRAPLPAPTVAFPVACPLEKCDGITSVEYPASATEVDVEAVPA